MYNIYTFYEYPLCKSISDDLFIFYQLNEFLWFDNVYSGLYTMYFTYCTDRRSFQRIVSRLCNKIQTCSTRNQSKYEI